MNTQIGFVMTDEDEAKFIEFIRKSKCTIVKKTVFEGEDPFKIYPISDVYSLGYFIADMYTDNDTLYCDTVCEGKPVKMITPYDNSMTAKPIIEFIRGRMSTGIGTLTLKTDGLSMTKRMHMMNKFRQLRDWIKTHSGKELDMGSGIKAYVLEGAIQQYKDNFNSFVTR